MYPPSRSPVLFLVFIFFIFMPLPHTPPPGLTRLQLLVWCCFISFFLLRYLTLGSNTNNRYRDTSVLLTEQINVQLRILQNSTNREASNKVLFYSSFFRASVF